MPPVPLAPQPYPHPAMIPRQVLGGHPLRRQVRPGRRQRRFRRQRGLRGRFPRERRVSHQVEQRRLHGRSPRTQESDYRAGLRCHCAARRPKTPDMACRPRSDPAAVSAAAAYTALSAPPCRPKVAGHCDGAERPDSRNGVAGRRGEISRSRWQGASPPKGRRVRESRCQNRTSHRQSFARPPNDRFDHPRAPDPARAPVLVPPGHRRFADRAPERARQGGEPLVKGHVARALGPSTIPSPGQLPPEGCGRASIAPTVIRSPPG
jgi:hypothetical protein